MNIIVSACLLGVPCRYDGTGTLHEKLKEMLQEHHLIPVCPELFGGLATPREPAELVSGRVCTKTGEDVTRNYIRGAKEVLRLYKLYDCTAAVLKERSPSCGSKEVYDGTFSRTLTEGKGITAELLSENGIKVFGESQIEEVLAGRWITPPA